MSDKKTDIASDAIEGLAAHEGAAVRRTWHADQWWFAVIDVVSALTDSENPEAICATCAVAMKNSPAIGTPW